MNNDGNRNERERQEREEGRIATKSLTQSVEGLDKRGDNFAALLLVEINDLLSPLRDTF